MAAPLDKSAEDARTAANMEAEVGVGHIAEVYAQAFLSAAEKAGQTAAGVAEFDALMTDLLDAHPRFQAILASAIISHEETSAILNRVLGGRVSPLLMNFLQVVSRHGRLDCLRAIHLQTHVLYDILQNRVRVQLITAEPLAPELEAKLRIALRAKLGGEPIMETVVDPNLIGGAVLKLGDTVYDGSIANQLNTLRQEMMDWSAHEIQSRRDRFVNPTRN
ncbi:MAG: ATP synthase F1 subunit delta [Pirellulales bacterium]|nr:ATP synthase F1 subunit delta [Pirellulales bacterium]